MKTKILFAFAFGLVLIVGLKGSAQDPNKKGLEALLRPGTRAYAIAVTPTKMQAESIVPGSFVDIIQTIEDKRKRVSRFVLENVKVLAIDIQPQAGQGPGQIPCTVSLEVDPKQCLMLASAQEDGTLTLRLHPKDKDNKRDGKPARDKETKKK
jgi:Flp pilus assembly protein CpaB